MPFVLDASIAAAWVLKGEARPALVGALDRLSGDWALVPVLWWHEIRNVLLVSERRGRLAEADTAPLLVDLSSLDLEIDPSRNEAATLVLARKHQLTFYDATYLELAMRERIDVATLDSALANAARSEGTQLVGDWTP